MKQVKHFFLQFWSVAVYLHIQTIKVPNWKALAQDRRRWKELAEKAKTL